MMAHSPEDIQNNNFQVEPGPPELPPAVITTYDPANANAPQSSATLLAQLVARNNDNLSDEAALSSLGSITYNDEYLEDPLPDLTFENLRVPFDYGDPSLGYVFVNRLDSESRLDNAEALLQQLQDLGVRVNEDYLTLDLELTTSRSASVSSVSDTASVSDEQEMRPSSEGGGVRHKAPALAPSARQRSQPNCERLTRLAEDGEEDVFLDIENLDLEVAEAEILPSGGVKVTYENYKKEYRSRISPQHNFLRYLELVHDGAPEKAMRDPEPSDLGASPRDLEDRYKRALSALHRRFSEKFPDIKVRRLSSLPSKYALKLRRFLAEEVTYDSVTPDSGVHENFNALSAEEQEKQREEWKAELTKTEEEIQTLRQVLGSKVKHAQDLKRRLGITVWREFTEDFNNSMKSVRESQTVQKANEVITEFHEAVAAAPLYRRLSGAFVELGDAIYQQPVYQKTAGAMSAVGEKTSSLFGGIGAKFGQLKETPTFKSFEERVGGVYSAARTRMGGSGSNSTQDFEEALKEAEGEKAALDAANGGTVPATTTPGTDVSQPAAS
ncbi:uncharacterized protein LOC122243110 isoform X2 [Penaeus japonicus]|uniref:uncharacterized protein LOC122243110 isoform X2 n=1 Tax=Penaeus japonicus TaxID=27405 RepID=UPI001C710EBA|nr:uncharacterized protein LOC122243110 isoform X2 [Penaeus japonicus]